MVYVCGIEGPRPYPNLACAGIIVVGVLAETIVSYPVLAKIPFLAEVVACTSPIFFFSGPSI
jgi:hypothetical protein